MKAPGNYQKAKLQYMDAYDYSTCELCEGRVECKYCRKEPSKGEKEIMCNLNGIHYHERCLRRAKQ
ncbi:MAG: hypothetical protein KGH72_05770 [Candidatus Micrarchaeota archaeon]|nr:hypothetical protein [Candidatus Micrarchaeota archaeon]